MLSRIPMRAWPLIAFCLTPSCAVAVSDDFGRTRSAIVGGAEVGTCAWPSVVGLESETGPCTGTLVHPEIVVFAAHCMTNTNVPPARASFGESVASPAFSVEVSGCSADPAFPGYTDVGAGHDLAYCKLAHRVDHVPIVPVLTRCETPEIVPGTTLVAVGFGNLMETGEGGGIKRAVDLEVKELVGDELHVGGDGFGTCAGDSGGPMFLRLPSGEYRLLAVTSWAPGACGAGEYAALVASGYDWLVSSAGVDLTARSPLHPEADVGAWPDACGDGASSESKASCAVVMDTGSGSDSAGCAFVAGSGSSGVGWIWLLFSIFVLSGRRPEVFRPRTSNSSCKRRFTPQNGAWHEARNAASHALVARSARGPDRSGFVHEASRRRAATEAR